jgi:2-methylisocitrate lyase-like PEP mutase family enzyme
MVEHGKTPARTLRELGAAGYRWSSSPSPACSRRPHALAGVYAVLHRDGTTEAARDRMMGFDALNALLGLEELYRRESEWLKRD